MQFDLPAVIQGKQSSADVGHQRTTPLACEHLNNTITAFVCAGQIKIGGCRPDLVSRYILADHAEEMKGRERENDEAFEVERW